MAEWTVTAKEILGVGEKIHEFPTKHIVNYRFTNKVGQAFRIRLLEDGRLEVSVDAQLIIYPRASNAIELGIKRL